jgi:branched-chain amino acid transport system ATP-binding protein
MLKMRAVETGYGDAQALFGIDLAIGEGEVVTLLGRNGMGKTTTIRALMGLLPVWKGHVEFDGQDLTKAPPFLRAQAAFAASKGRYAAAAAFWTLTATRPLWAALL